MSASRPMIQGIDWAEEWAYEARDGTPLDVSSGANEFFLTSSAGADVAITETFATSTTEGSVVQSVVTVSVAGTAIAALEPGYYFIEHRVTVSGAVYGMGKIPIEVKRGGA